MQKRTLDEGEKPFWKVETVTWRLPDDAYTFTHSTGFELRILANNLVGVLVALASSSKQLLFPLCDTRLSVVGQSVFLEDTDPWINPGWSFGDQVEAEKHNLSKIIGATAHARFIASAI
jgi:hypothetical protein